MDSVGLFGRNLGVLSKPQLLYATAPISPRPPEYIQHAVGTHPTSIHTCFHKILVNANWSAQRLSVSAFLPERFHG